MINDYLSTILSLPTAILVIGVIFFSKFAKSIRVFLENSVPKQFGPLATETKQTQSSIPVESKPPTSSESETPNLAEKVEFFYLDNQGLVFNTKVALLWFYLQPSHISTKQKFTDEYILPPNILNPLIEKEAIFGALLSSQLIVQSGEGYKVTEKGERFLKFIKLL